MTASGAARTTQASQDPLGLTFPGSGETVDESSQPSPSLGATTASDAPSTTPSSEPSEAGTGTPPTSVPDLPATKAPVEVGFITIKGLDGATQSLGVKAADPTAGWKPLIADANTHGGLGGHQIKPVYWELNLGTTANFQQQEQAACATWTQDHHVVAVITLVYTDTILNCLSKAKTPLVSMHTIATQSITTLHRTYPAYFEPVALDLDRAAAATVNQLFSNGYFTKGAKIGVVTFDDVRFRYAYDKAMAPALQAHNLKASQVAYLRNPQSVGDYTQVSSEAINTVVRFRGAGIDHVIFIDWGGSASLFFTLAAANQGFRPRYGLNSASGLQVLANGLGGQAKNQLTNALGIGWNPSSDVKPANNPDLKNPARIRCLDVLRRGGADTSAAADSANFQACDSFSTLRAAFDGASRLDLTTFVAGMNALGDRHRTASTWLSTTTAEQHDGVSSAATAAFVADCTCFRYTAKPTKL